MNEFEKTLAHFGVKGMHWGVRRTKSQIDSSADHQRVTSAKQKIKKGGTKTLSNEELQAVVTRMNLEQQFSRLKQSEPSKFSKGKAAVQTILGLAKTANEIRTVVNSPLGKDLRKVLSR